MLGFFKKITDDTRSIPLGIKLIIFVLFLRTFAWGFIDPFFGLYIDGFSEGYKGVGFLVSLMNVVGLLAAIPLLRLADKVQDTKIMRDGEILYLISAFFYLLGAQIASIFALTCGLVFNGIATSLFMIGAESYIRKNSGLSNSSKVFSFYIALNYLGWVLGMIIGAFTVQYYTLDYMFLILIPSIFASLFVLHKVHEKGLRSLFSGFHKYFHRAKDLKIIVDDIRHLNRRSIFPLFLAVFDGIIVMFSFIFVPLFAFSLDLGMRGVALLMAIMYLPFVFSFLITEATDRMSRMNVIILGLFVGAVTFAGLSLIIDQLWVAVLAVVNSFSLAIIRPAYNGMLTHLTPRHMLGEISGLNKIAMRVGYIIGPLFTGIFADKYGLQFIFLCIAIFTFSLAIITVILKKLFALNSNA